MYAKNMLFVSTLLYVVAAVMAIVAFFRHVPFTEWDATALFILMSIRARQMADVIHT